MGFLIAAKVLNVQVPYYFKAVVDALSIAPDMLTQIEVVTMVVPFSVLFGYGLARASASLFSELRSVLFAKVSQLGINNVSKETFGHLLQQDLQFHLSRNTGGLSRIIDRGTRGISSVLNAMLFNVVPTIFEIGLVCGILV